MDSSEQFEEQGLDSPKELMGPLAINDPFNSIRKALLEGFCAPLAETFHYHDKKETVTRSSFSPLPEAVILVHPVESSLKKTLQGFCDPDASKESHVDSECDHSLAVTRSYDSDDNTLIKNLEEDEAENEEDLVVALTLSGTSRFVRVFRGLETFFFVLLLLVVTISVLRLVDGSLGMELRHSSDARDEDWSYFSITARDVLKKQATAATTAPIMSPGLFAIVAPEELERAQCYWNNAST